MIDTVLHELSETVLRPKTYILAILIVCAVGWFLRNGYRLFILISQGLPENRLNNIPKRILNVVEQVFLHKRLLNRKDAGIAHVFFFYGFLVIQVCAIEIFARGFFPTFSYAFLGPLYGPLMFLQDIMCAGVIGAILFSAYRRTVLKPKHLMLTADAWLILGLILGVVSTIYVLGAADIALGDRDAVRRFMPFENALAGMVGGLSHGTLHIIQEAAWWAHVGIVLFFLNYLPYSKHLHLLGAIPNIFFAKTERIAALPTPDYEKEDLEIFGASEPAHFTWKHLLDVAACTECGRCTSVCPANATGKPLSPMKIIHDMKLAVLSSNPAGLSSIPGFGHLAKAPAHGDDHGHGGHDAGDDGHGADIPLIGGRISHEELWACTTCGGCVGQCPVLIEHVDDIVDMRRNLVLMQADFPPELQRTFTALENEGNPWGVSASSRGDYVAELGMKVLDDEETTPLLYWVGCAGAIDTSAKKTTAAVKQILDAAGVEYATLGACETCTGDPARRSGNEYLYQALAKANIETLNSHKVTKIVTACPHCYNTLQNEYPDLGGNYQVQHHTELIDDLIKEGKLNVDQKTTEKITLHDPCYLGRWNGKVEEPRSALEAIPGSELVEMERHGKDSFCCGAGGGRMWMEEHIGEPVNRVRSAEAVATGASTVAVGCPFCKTMITDGVKDLGKEETVKVKDVAELIAEALGAAKS